LDEKIKYTIEQVSEIVGVSKSKLRYWEKVYPLIINRTPTNRRRYSQETIDTFQRIKELDADGFNVRGIKKQLEKKRRLDERTAAFVGGPPPDPSCID
jgi:DNA-binding transcriptional MerR regulator